MKKYKVWTHIDTGVEQTITAESEEKAIELALHNLEIKEFRTQILDNTQIGDTDVMKKSLMQKCKIR